MRIESRLEETTITLPHRIPKPQKTIASDPKIGGVVFPAWSDYV